MREKISIIFKRLRENKSKENKSLTESKARKTGMLKVRSTPSREDSARCLQKQRIGLTNSTIKVDTCSGGRFSQLASHHSRSRSLQEIVQAKATRLSSCGDLQ
jgi:hypothetical protein